MRDSPSSVQFEQIEVVLGRIEQLAGNLRADPHRHVHRSTADLRDAFDSRRAIEPAVGHVLTSLRLLRRDNQDGSRREFHRRAPGLDYLERVVDEDLLPLLRRLGFDV